MGHPPGEFIGVGSPGQPSAHIHLATHQDSRIARAISVPYRGRRVKLGKLRPAICGLDSHPVQGAGFRVRYFSSVRSCLLRAGVLYQPFLYYPIRSAVTRPYHPVC